MLLIPAAALLATVAAGVPSGLAPGLPSCRPPLGQRLVPLPTTPIPAATVVHASRAFAMPGVGDLLLPGPPVRFEGVSLDTGTNRLFLAHADANQLVVVDVQNRVVVGTINDVQRPVGLIASPELERVYAGATGHGEIVVVAARSLDIVSRIPDAGYPVAVAYAPNPRRLYIANGRGSGVIVVDVFDNKVLTRIPLDGSVEGAAYDPVSACMLIAVGAELAVINPETDSVAMRIPLPGVVAAHAIAVDPTRHLAFVTSQANAQVAVVDLTAGRVTTTVTAGRGPDGVAVDPAWGRVYVGSETGTISVFTVLPDGTLAHDGDVIIPNAHTLTVDPRTHLLYVPRENVGGHPRLLVVAPAPPG
jgi:DNA-binding beta-propeller fold protein YncE